VNDDENTLRRKPWLMPLVAILAIILIVLVLAGGEKVAPLLYNVF